MRVVLGGIELRDFEKPDYLQLGGEQMLAVRVFPGGDRSIQNMGPNYRDITWSGQFIGPDAYDRMIAIGNLRTVGKQIELVTDRLTLPVLIKEFLPDCKHDRRIPFTITLVRVIDSTSGKSAPLVVDAIDKAATMIAKSDPKPQAKTYVVQAGDNLSKIAAKFNGNPNDWGSILKDPRNQQALKNGPHNLQIGVTLYV